MGPDPNHPKEKRDFPNDFGKYQEILHGRIWLRTNKLQKKAEHCRSLDVNRLHRDGCLQPGKSGNWIWSRDGAEIGRIGFRAELHCVVLNYRMSQLGSDWETVKQSIPLTYVNCHYGGQRPYFKCPGIVNGHHYGRRVGKVFAGGKYFLCRHCYDVAYSSQSEGRHDRLLRRANKIRMELGGAPGTANWIAAKPKGNVARDVSAQAA